uniref:MIF4G domain-containing protein n=1 Tax=viral metagenome TaxID=1070528 RepID=A0A6C0I0A2_9ZZZZ
MYTLSQFADIRSTYSLPIEVKQKIHALCKQLGTELPFTMVQESVQLKDCLRELNKMTDENQEEKRTLLCSILEQHQEEIPAFAPIFFQALCKQVFFSKMYASLFLTLQQWPIFQDVFQTHFSMYEESFHTIRTCSPDDYDEYCKLKKENDERRAFSVFMVYCVQNGSVSQSCYEKTMETLEQCIRETVVLDKKEVMNEYVEHLYLLVTTMKQMHPLVQEIIKMNPKEYPGLNHKMIFRCMDIKV